MSDKMLSVRVAFAGDRASRSPEVGQWPAAVIGFGMAAIGILEAAIGPGRCTPASKPARSAASRGKAA